MVSKDRVGTKTSDLPNFRLLLYKGLHHLLTLLILEHNDLNTSLLQVSFTANKVLVLSYYYAGYLIHNAGARAHVTG